MIGCFALAGAGSFLGFRSRGRRDGVITAATPGMTAENPTNSIPRAAEGTVELDGLKIIIGTARRVAAAHGRAGGGFQHRIEDPLIETDQETDHGAEEAGDHDFSSARGNRPSRRAWRSQSASSSAKVALEAPGRAMVT